MKHTRYWIVLLLLLIGLSGCASVVSLGSLQRPPETTRLRVALLSISGFHRAGGFAQTHEAYKSLQYHETGRQLQQLDYYEIVPEHDVAAVIGDQELDRWSLTRNRAELARSIGKALFAEYVMLIERSVPDREVLFRLELINVATGDIFEVVFSRNIQRGETGLLREAYGYGYRELFQDAKGDLLATAMKKATGVSGGRELTKSERLMVERQAASKAAEGRLAAEMVLAKQAELDRVAAEDNRRKAQQERHKAETMASDAAERLKTAVANVEAERRRVSELARNLEHEKDRSRTESARIAAEYERRIAAERIRENAEKARLAAEMAAREKAAVDRLNAEKLKAEQKAAEELNRLRETERQHHAARDKAKKEVEEARAAAERAMQDKLRAEQQLAQFRAAEPDRKQQHATARVSGRAVRPEDQAATERSTASRGKLIVYDIAAAADELRSVALILSEAMREELFQRGGYELVNRENLKQIMEELKFQQSGMVSETDAIRIGKSMAAREIVLGQLASIGNSLVLQSKRIDMTTMGNLSFASIRCESGREETILDRLKELVDKLFKK